MGPALPGQRLERLPALVTEVDVDPVSADIFRMLDAANPDLVCCAGWLCLLDVPQRYRGKVMNIHPALLPKFGGKGMHGHHVHSAILAAGEKESGCTVHFADNTYDTGPTIIQKKVPVHPTDTPDTLAARVFEQECLAYPEAIRMYIAAKKRPPK